MNGGYTWVCVKSRVLYHLFIFAKKTEVANDNYNNVNNAVRNSTKY